MTLRGLLILALLSIPAVAKEETPSLALTEIRGRVMLRPANKSGIELPKSGRGLSAGDVLITGEKSQLEVQVGETGFWRIGRRSVFSPQHGGGTLTAGTALVRIPSETGWRIDGSRSAVRLGKGLWIIQAVDNEGLKLICLDGPARATALGEAPAEPENTTVLPTIKIEPGQLVFLTPAGKSFGPVVTIYLEELLVTSRLVNGFAGTLPDLRRLQTLAIAQREQLKGVTNALVAGARADNGFEVVIPKSPAPESVK